MELLLPPLSIRRSFRQTPCPPPHSSRFAARAAVPQEKVEIRVCVNRTCSRQGSRDALSVLADIAPRSVSVASCGCLGRCGAGPNLVVLPAELLIGHCGTPARAADVLGDVVPGFDPRRSLQALALRKKGEAELSEKGNAAEAEALFSQAIVLEPSGGLHVLFKLRSVARLAMGNLVAALDDAKESSRQAPDYPQAYLSQGDIFMAMEEYTAAEQSYLTALQLDPSIRRSKSYKARVLKLQQRLASTNT